MIHSASLPSGGNQQCVPKCEMDLGLSAAYLHSVLQGPGAPFCQLVLAPRKGLTHLSRRSEAQGNRVEGQHQPLESQAVH